MEIAWLVAMGPLDKHYDLVESGIADVAFCGATPPAQFDLELFSSMPWNLPEAERTFTSYWELYNPGHFEKEFALVKPFFAWNSASRASFSIKPVSSIADLKGMKIAISVPYDFKFLKAVDSVSVSLVPPEQLGALKKYEWDLLENRIEGIRSYLVFFHGFFRFLVISTNHISNWSTQ